MPSLAVASRRRGRVGAQASTRCDERDSPLRVTGCLYGPLGTTVGVPQIAADAARGFDIV
jgi:hypothetical protein